MAEITKFTSFDIPVDPNLPIDQLLAQIVDLLPAVHPIVLSQEEQGMEELLRSSLLPMEMHQGRPIFELLGFKFGKIAAKDQLFVEAKMPDGWMLEAGSEREDFFAYIIDKDRRRRVLVFYKASAHDRRAKMSLIFAKGSYDATQSPSANLRILEEQFP